MKAIGGNMQTMRRKRPLDGEGELALVRRRPEGQGDQATARWAGLGVGLGAAALVVGVIALFLLFRRTAPVVGALAAPALPPPAPNFPSRRLLEEGFV